jgi:hypothetical protein
MAKFNAWSAELEAALAEPFPAEFVSQLKKKNNVIDFVSWHHYARRLNELVGPGWSVGELSMRDVGGKLLIGLPLTILGTTRTNVGTEDEGKDDYGDAATNAWAMAFKRTCSLFGLGLGMYDKAGSVAQHQNAEHKRALDFIKSVGARCEEDVMMTLEGKQLPLKAAVRDGWKTMQRERRAALDFAKAIEESTGQPFSAST